ncbi:MAG: polyprenol monophosphomannose synthase [Patescibacteria group bacterium]|jgi:dolichol-phosphate mannosyltransferase
MKDILLLPTYNERENVKMIIPEIFSLIPEIVVMVIDDNSPDGTAQAVQELMTIYPRLRILKREKKTGLGNAYKEAMRLVMAEDGVRSVITMDADGSHQPKYLVDFLANINDYDLIIGSRYIRGGGVENWEFWRRCLSRFGNIYSKILTGLPINDFTAGFMCVKVDFLKQLDLVSAGASGYSFLIELKFNLIHNLKARVKEVPIIFKVRREGESKLSNSIIGEGIMTPLRICSRRIWQNKK